MNDCSADPVWVVLRPLNLLVRKFVSTGKSFYERANQLISREKYNKLESEELSSEILSSLLIKVWSPF